jgi:histidinol phosphatase-like PHP family hydrolase
MIDFHTHTLLSDGVLVPAEHIRQAEMRGYRVLGFADHADWATMAAVLPALREAAARENRSGRIRVLVGVELTHLRPGQIAEAAKCARDLGAQYVICHGQTLVEPVEPGTNRAGIEAGVDILAHPGLLSEDDARRAAERGVLLEISAKGGHCLANGHVAAVARMCGAKLLFGSDAHAPEQMPTRDFAGRVAAGAGLSAEEIAEMFATAEAFAAARAPIM